MPPNKNLFRLIRVVGRGGFGKVWKVERKKDCKFFAMKEMEKMIIIEKKSVSSVLNERKLLAQLNHKWL